MTYEELKPFFGKKVKVTLEGENHYAKILEGVMIPWPKDRDKVVSVLFNQVNDNPNFKRSFIKSTYGYRQSFYNKRITQVTLI